MKNANRISVDMQRSSKTGGAGVRKLDVAALKREARERQTRQRQVSDEDVQISPRIGFQLRRERRVRGLRLKDVAQAAGLSLSLISKIENNRVSPSLSTLHRLAKALGTSVSALFTMDETLDKVVHRPHERPVAGRVQSMVEWDGIEAEIMVPFASGRLLEGFVFVMQPGSHSGGTLRHEGEECGYVLEGKLELTVGDVRYELDPGDSFFFPSEIPHSYRNPGDKVARVIWINTPPTF